MTPRRPLNPWLVRGFQVAVAVGLLAVVWRFADGANALQLLSQANIGWMAAAVLVLSAQIFLSARRWQITAGQLGIVVSFSTALREYYLAQLVNQALPGGVIGDASRAVRAGGQRGLLASGQSVIFERLSGQVTLIGLMLGAIAITLVLPGGLDWPSATWPVFLVAIGLIVVLPAAVWILVRALPAGSAEAVRSWGRSARKALLARAVLGQQLTLSVATALANVAGFVFCSWAIGADVGFGVALAVVPLILLTMLIPVTVSGWGLREAAAATLFPLGGFVASEGLATSVAFGFVLIIISLPGLFFARGSTSTAPRPSAGS